MWVLKKVRHVLESSRSKVIVQTDHLAILDITQQSSISSMNSTIPINVRLVRALQFLCQLFKLEIRHKLDKEHIVFDALSHLVSANTNLPSLDPEYSELDALYTYTTTLVNIHSDLIKRIINAYKVDECWSKLLRQVKDNEALAVGKAILSFVKRIPIRTDSYLYFTPRPGLPHLIFGKVSQCSCFSGLAELALPVGPAQTSSTFHLELAFDRDPPLLEYPEPGVETAAPADKKELLYHFDKLTGVHRLCIPPSVAIKIITLAHDAGHPEFS